MISITFNKRDAINNFTEILFIITLAFIGTQRLLMPALSAYVCLIPFIIFLYYEVLGVNRPEKIIYLIIAIFLSVDNGGNFYYETPAFIRYPLYISLIYYLVTNTTINLKNTKYFFVYVLFLLLITVFNHEMVNLNVFFRDIFILFLIFIAINKSSRTLLAYKFSPKLLNKFLIFYIIFESINGFLFLDLFYGEYLNYDSTKALIILPSLILFSEKKYLKFLLLGLATFYVLAWYGSRMISLIYVTALIMILIRNISFNRETLIFLPFVFITISFLALYFFNVEFKQTPKIIELIQDILISTSFIDLLKILDPIRFYEHILFFDRNIFNILFGSGLGTGIYDHQNLMGFVSGLQTAFSNEELSSKIFYNFHDLHIDFGLRFGLVVIIFVLIKLIINFFKSSPENKYLSTLLICMIFTMFFSTSGLLLITLFYMIMSKKKKIL